MKTNIKKFLVVRYAQHGGVESAMPFDSIVQAYDYIAMFSAPADVLRWNDLCGLWECI